VTTTLLSDGEWRSRSVEDVSLGSERWITSRRSLQVAPLFDFLRGFLCCDDVEQATLLLPVATLPKGPLLSFDVTAPDLVTAYLPKRRVLAEREAHFVVATAAAHDIAVSARLQELLTAICEFTPGIWQGWDRDQPNPLHSYLSDAVQQSLPESLVASWAATVAPASAALAAELDEGAQDASSAENPLLAIPLLLRGGRLDVPDVGSLLEEFAEFISKCASATPSGTYTPHGLLAEYGVRWEAMVHCTVPLHEPFLARMSEQRLLSVGRRGTTRITVTTADAASNHIVVRVTDPHVEIHGTPQGRRRLRQPRQQQIPLFSALGVPLEEAHFEGVRKTREQWSLYGSAPDREYQVEIRPRLKLSQPYLSANLSVEALTGVACVLVAVRWGCLTAADLAVIVIPTTLAAAFLVTRDTTTLATRLQRATRLRTTALVVVLWAMVALAYALDVVKS
jgi:hypothetical protein